ncbi:MAG: hypothetical protein NTV11_00720 [Rhodocyclales bacterium]|nr:hypothetical protein [Rhodocyclales bacterium]
MIGDQIDSELAAAEVRRPLRDLILLLPHLQVRTGNNLDYEGAEPALLQQIETNADITMRTVHRGTAAIGRLLVAVSPECGTGELPADCLEALGWLLSEMGDLAATAHNLAAGCQRYTADYAPRAPKHIPNARP